MTSNRTQPGGAHDRLHDRLDELIALRIGMEADCVEGLTMRTRLVALTLTAIEEAENWLWRCLREECAPLKAGDAVKLKP